MKILKKKIDFKKCYLSLFLSNKARLNYPLDMYMFLVKSQMTFV